MTPGNMRPKALLRSSLLFCCFVVSVTSAGSDSSQNIADAAPAKASTASAPEMPTSKPRKKSQKMGLKEYLKEKGRVQDIPKAVIIYESLGMTIMFTFLTVAYVLEPTKNGILGPLKRFTDGSRFQQLQEAADRRLGWLGRSLRLDPMRLATSYAECTLVRLVLKPVLVPLKLYITWHGLMLWIGSNSQ